MKAHMPIGILHTSEHRVAYITSVVYIQSVQVWVSGFCFCKRKDGISNE